MTEGWQPKPIPLSPAEQKELFTRFLAALMTGYAGGNTHWAEHQSSEEIVGHFTPLAWACVREVGKFKPLPTEPS